MSDTINFTDLFGEFNVASIFERLDRSEETNPEQAEETTRVRNRRSRLRFTFGRRSERSNPAFRVDLTQRARRAVEMRRAETQPAAAEEEPEQAEQTAQTNRAAPQGRAALLRRFQLANIAQPATEEGEAGGGVVTIPVALERGARRGGETAAAETTERPRFQARELPTILANREPPRLDSVRMAASFEYTALGTALNANENLTNRVTGPADEAAQRLGAGANLAAPAGLGMVEPNRLAAGRDNAAGLGGLGADTPLARTNQPAQQGPLARVQERLENPGNTLLDSDQRTPLAAGRLAQGGNIIGADELQRPALVEPVNPGAPDEANEASRAGIGTENLDRITGQAEVPGANRLAEAYADVRIFNTPEQPLARANAAPGQTAPGDQAGLRRDDQVGGGPVAPEQGPPVPNNAMPGNELAGAAGEPGGAAGLPPPQNPLEPQQPALAVNDMAAPLGNNPGQAVPQLADLQAPPEPEEPLNPPMPEPAPPETPAERAAAIRQTPAEAADTELRANVPAPPEPAAGEPNAPAAPAIEPPEPGEAGPAAAAGPAGAPETAPAPRAGVPVEAGAEEETGPGVAPPRAAEEEPTGPARNENRGEEEPVARPGEEAEEENQAQTRAIVAYELQQMEARTNEPNERRTVTEMFIR